MNETILHLIDRYIGYLRRSGYRHQVIANNRRQLDVFALWAESRDVIDIDAITLGIIRGYYAHLSTTNDSKGRPVNLMIQRECRGKLRRFLSWLHREGMINVDLSAGVPTVTRKRA